MRHQHRGVAGLTLQPLQLAPGGVPFGSIEVGQRLIEQQHRRLAHDGARQADPLFLPAGRPPGLRSSSREMPRRSATSRGALGAGSLPSGRACRRRCSLPRSAAGRAHSSRRPPRHCARARAGRRRSARHLNVAAGRLFQAGDHAQRGRFAAAGRPEQASNSPSATVRSIPATACTGGLPRRWNVLVRRISAIPGEDENHAPAFSTCRSVMMPRRESILLPSESSPAPAPSSQPARAAAQAGRPLEEHQAAMGGTKWPRLSAPHLHAA